MFFIWIYHMHYSVMCDVIDNNHWNRVFNNISSVFLTVFYAKLWLHVYIHISVRKITFKQEDRRPNCLLFQFNCPRPITNFFCPTLILISAAREGSWPSAVLIQKVILVLYIIAQNNINNIFIMLTIMVKEKKKILNKIYYVCVAF